MQHACSCCTGSISRHLYQCVLSTCAGQPWSPCRGCHGLSWGSFDARRRHDASQQLLLGVLVQRHEVTRLLRVGFTAGCLVCLAERALL